MAVRPRRTLIAAFALSLLIHLLAGPFIRKTDIPDPTAPSYPFTIETAHPNPPPPTPQPTPRPKPQNTPPLQSRSNALAPPHQSQHNPRTTSAPTLPSHSESGGPGPGTGGHGPASDGVASQEPSPLAIALPTSTPTVVPTATPACAHPEVAASTVEAASVDTPSLAQQNGISGIVDIIVRLDEHSHVVSARIAHTPSPLLNDAALRAARSSIFRTEVRDCQPVAAEYVFSVEFDAQ